MSIKSNLFGFSFREKVMGVFKAASVLLWNSLQVKLKVACFDKERMFQPPVKATQKSAGADIYSIERIRIQPGESFETGTNLIMAIQPGWVGLILPRSGLGFEYEVRLANTIGVIDSDFRGHVKIKVSLPSNAKKEFNIAPGERFCQILLVPDPGFEVVIDDAENFDKTSRGDGGLGHTGTG